MNTPVEHPVFRVTRELRHPLDLHAAVRTTHPEHLNHNGCAELHARQIAHFPLAHLVRLLQLPAASRANQLPVAPFPSGPKLQGLRPLINLVPVHPVARPPQQFRQFAVSQTAEFTGFTLAANSRRLMLCQIPAQSPSSYETSPFRTA